MNNRESLLKKISMLDFAMIELHLILDTHPNDRGASSKLSEYRMESEELTREFISKYGPLSMKDKNDSSWEWIANPWPWDNTCMEGK